MKKKKQIAPLAFGFYFWPVIGLLIAGLADTIYLSFSHYKLYTDIGYQSFCAITRAVNCDTVSLSEYAILAGVPLAVWGVLGYGSLLTLAMLGYPGQDKPIRLWGLIFVISVLFCMHSIFLAFVSNYYIRSYCIMCILSYVVNFIVCFYAYIIVKRFYGYGVIRTLKKDILFILGTPYRSIGFILIIVLISGSLITFFPQYWKFEAKESKSYLARGVTEEGYPWIGAVQPEVEIYMFSDYQCFQCKKMHFFLRNLLDEYPDKFRLIHLNFPMDHEVNPVVRESFHVGSGALALMAKYAASQGKFWEMNDYLFYLDKKGKVDIEKTADHVGLDPDKLAASIRDRALLLSLKQEIEKGLKLSITATPSYLVNGTVYVSTLPREVLNSVMEE